MVTHLTTRLSYARRCVGMARTDFIRGFDRAGVVAKQISVSDRTLLFNLRSLSLSGPGHGGSVRQPEGLSPLAKYYLF